MNIVDIFNGCTEEGKIPFSLEFFPPKTDKGWDRLYRTMKALLPLSPAYVSVTYGAGGSTRERTHSTVKRLLNETDLLPAAHLTCVDATTSEIDTPIAEAERHIVGGTDMKDNEVRPAPRVPLRRNAL